MSTSGKTVKNLEQLVMTRALVKLERKLGKWDQGSWTTNLKWNATTEFLEPTCGTNACVAGWAVIANGGKFLANDLVLAEKEDGPDLTSGWLTHKGKTVPVVSVRQRAQRLLGLTPEEAYWLFDGGNTHEDVERLLKRFIKDGIKQHKERTKVGSDA